MATILLLNFDPEPEARLWTVLQGRGHRVLKAGDGKPVTVGSYIERNSVDLIIFNLTCEADDLRNKLRDICCERKTNGHPVPVLCYSAIYRGPSLELDVEESGARLAYGD